MLTTTTERSQTITEDYLEKIERLKRELLLIPEVMHVEVLTFKELADILETKSKMSEL